MTLVLKYWAKKNALINTEAFSSYAFTQLIIFYLQTITPRILPPIGELQELARKQNKPELQVHRWNFEFCDDVQVVRNYFDLSMFGRGFFFGLAAYLVRHCKRQW